MFKSRRAVVPKCKKSRQTPYKLEGNSNITANRVTIPPGFLSRGVRSETAHKSSHSQNDCILTENLHGLFNVNLEETYNKPRRSARVSKQTNPSYESLTAFEYFCKNSNNQKRSHPEDEPKVSPHRPTVRDNSKSLFRQINERCARAQSVGFNYPIRAVLEPHSKIEHFRCTNFCLNLFGEVSVDLSQYDCLRNVKLAVAAQIRDINRRLQGKMDLPSRAPDGGRAIEPNGFQYVPRDEWVLKTPPRQGVVLPQLEQCAIQPAVICTTRKRNNIYELNPDFNLAGFSSRQNVQVDGRFMKPLASFPQDGGFGVTGFPVPNRADSEEDLIVTRRAGPKKPACSAAASKPFAHVTCRPIKTVRKLPRLESFYTHVSERDLELTPTGPDLFQSVEELERDVTFVEDNGTFKMVNSQASKSEGHFNFKFRKNLFKGNDDKMFNFDGAEPKLFNFANLKN